MINFFVFNFQTNYILISFFLLWIIEWISFFDFVLGHWTTNNFFFFYRTPVFLVLFFIFWLYVWGISAWRRSLFGKFTRGERQLWYKSLVAFWIVEIFTIGGFVMAAAWMSWGPRIFMPRFFWIPKKGFLLEITIFSYIIWLIYLFRFSLKFYLWKTQVIFLLIVLCLSSYLLWRDYITLWTRDLLTKNNGTHWRFVKLITIIYSLENNWWFNLLLGKKGSLNHQLIPLNKIIRLKMPIIEKTHFNYINYEEFYWLPVVDKTAFHRTLVPHWPFFMHYYNFFYFLQTFRYRLFFLSHPSYLLDVHKFLPRRLGFVPKKIAMWYFFIILKMWHHLMLFIWWFFFLQKLIVFKKTSYSFFFKCYFNVYCCFILGWVVYLFQLFPTFELFLKNRPKHITWIYFKTIYVHISSYLFSIFNSYSSKNLNLFLNHSKIFIQHSSHFQELINFPKRPLIINWKFPKQIADSLQFKVSLINFYTPADIAKNLKYI